MSFQTILICPEKAMKPYMTVAFFVA